MRHVVMFSGGLGSWLTAKRVTEKARTEDMVLLFADVASSRSPHVGEDEDTYRFINEAVADIGAELVTVSDGRDIWQVFHDDRFLGNSRLANCSKFLKQKPCREWLEANCDPAETIVYVGIDWTELHRLPAIERGWAPYPVHAPLTEPPLIDRDDMRTACEAAGIEVPRLYRAGFPHNNCGGFCVRAGQAQMELLLREHPERYAFHEAEEQKLRDHLGKDVSVLKARSRDAVLRHVGASERDLRWVLDSVCGDDDCTASGACGHESGRWVIAATGEPLPSAVPLTLRGFRERLESQPGLFDELEWGGCGCFTEGGVA